MRAIFLGTPAAAVPSLDALSDIAEVTGVISRPDRPRGRSGTPRPSEVTAAARATGIDVSQPDNASGLTETIAHLVPFDVAVVVAYGMLIQPEALALARVGFINVHFSILPRWRGAAPVQRAILAGDERSGVSLMAMDVGLDTGPVLSTAATQISPREDAAELTDRLAAMGAVLLRRWLPAIVAGTVAPTLQDPVRVTHAAKLGSDERWIDVGGSVGSVLGAVRGLSPWPGAWVRHNTGAVRLLEVTPGSSRLDEGSLSVTSGDLELGVGDGSVRIVRLQPEGKRAMGGMDWARGLRADLGGVT